MASKTVEWFGRSTRDVQLWRNFNPTSFSWMFHTPGWDQRNQYQVAVSGLGGGRKSSFVTGGESCEEKGRALREKKKKEERAISSANRKCCPCHSVRRRRKKQNLSGVKITISGEDGQCMPASLTPWLALVCHYTDTVLSWTQITSRDKPANQYDSGLLDFVLCAFGTEAVWPRWLDTVHCINLRSVDTWIVRLGVPWAWRSTSTGKSLFLELEW